MPAQNGDNGRKGNRDGGWDATIRERAKSLARGVLARDLPRVAPPQLFNWRRADRMETRGIVQLMMTAGDQLDTVRSNCSEHRHIGQQ